MSFDMMVQIEGITGESPIPGFEEWIQILSWNWDLHQTGTTHEGLGGGAGKAQFGDITFTHYVDASTPSLIKYCATGVHWAEASLVVRKAGGETQVESIRMTLSNGIVTAVNTGGSSGDDRLTESVTLNFGEFNIVQKSQLADGTEAAEKTFAFNIANNVEV